MSNDIVKTNDIDISHFLKYSETFSCEKSLFETSWSTCASNCYGGASILRIKNTENLQTSIDLTKSKESLGPDFDDF